MKANDGKFETLIRQDIAWLEKQEQTCETGHISCCLRWLLEDGYELLNDIQKLNVKPNN